MKKFALLCLLFAASPLLGDHFTVVNRMDERREPSVVNRIRMRVEHRQGSGHTHACPNGNCSFRKAYGEPYVWSHDMDGGTHLCKYCKTQQLYVSNRPVTVLRAEVIPSTRTIQETTYTPHPTEVRVANRMPVAFPSRPGYPVEYRLTYPVLKRANDCANGNCAYVR